MAVIEKSITGPKLNVWQKALFILAAMLVLDLTGFSQPIQTIFARGLAPVQHVWVRGLNNVYSLWQGVQKLPKSVARIQDLELRVAESSASLAELATLRRENEELRFLLENTDRSSERTVITVPIITFAQPAIAAGSQAGIQEGAVVLSRSTLLGRVSRVAPYESQVLLLSAERSQPVLAQTETGVKGLVVGDGKKILFTQVSKESVLTVGQRVVTLGQPQIEQNLPIGRIIRVINDPVASVQSAIIEQYASFFETPVVEVR